MISKPKFTQTRRLGEILLAACFLASLFIPAAQATPGALDPGFGTGGGVTTAIGLTLDVADSLALQPDGKLVAGGWTYNGTDDDFALARYNPDGSLDTGFNGNGTVTTAIGAADDYAGGVALQPDGKIVAAGASHNGSSDDIAVARYNPDGSLDTSFHGTGTVTTAIGSGDDYANELVLQPDGKLVAAGASWNGANYDFALVRYNPDGSLDTSFHGTGMVTTPIGSGNDGANALAVQPDGKLVAAGFSNNGFNNDFALVRYNSDGSLDTSFHGTGMVTTALGPGHDTANGLALEPNGKLVAAGWSFNGSNGDFAVVRYNADGSLDTSFNGTGKVTTAVGPGNEEAYAVALRPDGKLLAAGSSNNGSNNDFALARYNPDGSLDTSFHGSGTVTTAVGSGGDGAYALTLQPDGRPIAAGYSFKAPGDEDFALVRYLDTSTLTVAKSGSGSGSVTSSPAAIDCGSTCSASFAGPVTLTASPSLGSSFVGWSGDCSGTGACSLSMSADQTATAMFESEKSESNKTLTLTKAGRGSGLVSSNPSGIACGSVCAHVFTHGTAVTLTATPSSGSSFIGWSGSCSGRGSCTLTMTADQATTATFAVLCVVPKLKGKTLRAAKLVIGNAHCSLGKVTRAYSAKVRKGRVISQKPRPGTKLTASARVRLTLSKGKKP